MDDGVEDGVELGCGWGPTVEHWLAQKAVSWCSQKHRSMHVVQLAQAGAREHPVVTPPVAPAEPNGFDESGSSLEPPPAEQPASATQSKATKCRRSAMGTV